MSVSDPNVGGSRLQPDDGPSANLGAAEKRPLPGPESVVGARSSDPSHLRSTLEDDHSRKPTWRQRLPRSRTRKVRLREAEDHPPRPSTPPPLTREEIGERLRLNSATIVDDLHALALRQIQAEDQRESRLDAKAQGLLITSGLSLTVAFTFGGMLLEHPDYLDALSNAIGAGRWPARFLIGLYVFALIAGLLASVQRRSCALCERWA